LTFVQIGEIIPYKTLQWKRARFVFLMKTRPTPDTDSTETELTLLKFRLDQNQSCSPHTRSRSQSRRTLVVSRHCFSSSYRRWPHTTTLFDAKRSQSWAALSGLTEEKDAIFVLVSYRPLHINFLRDWTISDAVLNRIFCVLQPNGSRKCCSQRKSSVWGLIRSTDPRAMLNICPFECRISVEYSWYLYIYACTRIHNKQFMIDISI
jgi:hypothetical protein